MDTQSITDKIKAATDWVRSKPLAVVLPVGVLIIVAGLSLVSGHGHRAAAPAAPATAAAQTGTPMVGRPTTGASTPVATATPPATPVTQPAAVAPPAPAVALASAPAVAAASTTAAPAPALPAPPTGLASGYVQRTLSQQDQYGQLQVVSTSVEPSQSTAFTALAPVKGSPAWSETLTSWIHLASPATVAVLRTGHGFDTATAAIDGASLGAPLVGGPATDTASLSLAPGWHQLVVTVSGEAVSAYYAPPAMPVEIQIGDGTTTPAPVTPYAVPAGAAAHVAPATPPASSPAARAAAEPKGKIAPVAAPTSAPASASAAATNPV